LTSRGAATRNRIVLAAAELMHVQGVAATTIDDVLAASATSKSQFYQHFDDKSELVYEVITMRADEILSWQRLRLEKVVDKATALPGANLTYTVTFINDSTSPISNLKVSDSTPAYTTFVSAACGSPLPNSLTACAITAPTVGQTGAIQWTYTGSLAPSQTGTVTFVVKIQ